jgi:putative flippase GtrA
MSKPFDMELFLRGVLTGSHTTRQRHLSQAKAIQAAISNRWHTNNPWVWQQKHLAWFLNHHMNQHAESTRYYYLLTIHLLTFRLGKSWQFNR